MAEGHTHTTQDGTTDAASNLPPYLDMVYASIDSDGIGEADSILIVSTLPPLGWERFTALDGAFPRGAASYGGTGGSETHSHDVTITTGGPSATGGSKAIGQTTASASHTHSCNTTTETGSNIPPYMDVIFAQRNDPAVSTSLGSEISQEEFEAEPVSYQYAYDGDGAMVIESTGVITTVYVGGIFEYVISDTQIITRSYYFAGSQRVAMREGGELFYLLGDHLGSTSLTLDANGNKVAEQRYKPWGGIRYSSGQQVTDYSFTGQRDGGFGLLYYNARWYDNSLGRFAQADTDVPASQGVQAWDRYAYVNNNSVRYIDPTGHFAIVPLVVTVVVIVVGWLATAPPVYAPASEVDQAALAEKAESRWQTKAGNWIDEHPIEYCAIVTFCVHGAFELAGTLANTPNDNDLKSTSWDMTQEEFLNGRAAYEREVLSIKDRAQEMLEEGYSLEEVAKWAYNERREIGIRYKDLTPPNMREEIYKRNIGKYGDPLGPSFEYYLDRGDSFDDIINSAAKPGGEDIIPKILEEYFK